jgi:hypothetical protein
MCRKPGRGKLRKITPVSLMSSSIGGKEGLSMNNKRSLRVTCPACEIDYRLRDETLLPIARCGRCYGAVVAEGAIRDVAYGVVTAPTAKAA